jgi:hypothetical protein
MGECGSIEVQLNLGWAWFSLLVCATLLSKQRGGEAMEIKDAILIMIAFSTFVVALLTYIANNHKRK